MVVVNLQEKSYYLLKIGNWCQELEQRPWRKSRSAVIITAQAQLSKSSNVYHQLGPTTKISNHMSHRYAHRKIQKMKFLS